MQPGKVFDTVSAVKQGKFLNLANLQGRPGLQIPGARSST